MSDASTDHDLFSLEADLSARIAAAGDEASLEAVRIAALGKQGSISALLKTLGPEPLWNYYLEAEAA